MKAVYYVRQDHSEGLSEELILSKNLNDVIAICQVLVSSVQKEGWDLSVLM